MTKLKNHMSGLYSNVGFTVNAQLKRAQKAADRKELAKFTKDDFLFVSREDFHRKEELCLRWFGPCKVV